MNKVDFNYNDIKFFVQCNNDDKMKDIIDKFLAKSGKSKKNIFFLYNGQIINEELIFKKCANSLDRSRNYMNVLVIEQQGTDDDSINYRKSDYVICPNCKENAFISINNFNISIKDCPSDHKTEDIHLNEFDKTQYIDQSKIKCDRCQNLKCDTVENKFFICNTCKQNLCPSCKDNHDKSHFDNIKDYDKNQFYCKLHSNAYVWYCSNCKKDLCSLCQNEHKKHKLITYDSIMPDIETIRNNELKDTKQVIYEIKTIINGMINQLNQLNKNLNIYFEIYNNIITNFDNSKRNYSLIQNINTMQNYNNNFIGQLTEIIKDNNLKSQFTNIISLQTKIEFKKRKNKKTEGKENSEGKTNKNQNENIVINNKDDNIEKYNQLDDKYENFNINQMKELQTFTPKNEIENLLILKDGRILTLQYYFNENGDTFYKLCVYSINNGFVCDINMDFDSIYNFF